MNISCKYLTSTRGGQDGAIYNGLLFRFDNKGNCRVFDVNSLLEGGKFVSEIDSFTLDKSDIIAPHSNSVVFGSEFYCEGDEFPLLYSNVYNNYAKTDDPMRGVCCAYRLTRLSDGFETELVQLIEIGFVEDANLWKASPEAHGKRPFGNFVIDTDENKYYAFVMREGTEGTRYFCFDLPRVQNGEPDARFGVKRAVLQKEDILFSFDCEHHKFIQGACCRKGLIYSLEGFNYDPEVDRQPAIRIIDPKQRKQIFHTSLVGYGFDREPEVIDFYGDVCLASDAYGKIYQLEFE